MLEKFGVEMIGANAEVIAKAEDRDLFKAAMERIGLEVPRGQTVDSLEEARRRAARISACPASSGPASPWAAPAPASPTTGEEFDELVAPRPGGLRPIHQVLLEESVLGWKEFEMEVMRDQDDNVVIICSIENFDPMGVHTGDSITVAPAQTLTDKEYQRMRDASIAVIREIGVETGGSNIQFAVDPADRADGGHRDEPARQPLQRPGLEGHGLPHRQDRRQAGRRLPPARDAQRHHPRDHGLLRADDRLRGDQGAAVRLREVPRGRSRS